MIYIYIILLFTVLVINTFRNANDEILFVISFVFRELLLLMWRPLKNSIRPLCLYANAGECGIGLGKTTRLSNFIKIIMKKKIKNWLFFC